MTTTNTRRFETADAMAEALAQAMHEANLERGGVYTDDPETAGAEGYDVREDPRSPGHFRVSMLSMERSSARAKVRPVSTIARIMHGLPIEAAWMIERGELWWSAG